MTRSSKLTGRHVLGSAALVSALGFALSWLCCIVPLAIFGSIGVATAALGVRLEPYRWLLQGVAVLAVGISFFLAYRTREVDGCDRDAACARLRRSRRAAWLFAAAVLLLLTSPYWMGLLSYWTL